MKLFNERAGEKGFTLIELLVIIAIIGILAAIAIPTYASYRSKSLDAAVLSDLRNAATAQEAYFLDNETYSPVISNLETLPYNFYRSQDVNITVTSADTQSYTITAVHSGSGKIFVLSGPGGSIDS
jgi:type IV pilus assembly protein PilA